MQSMQYNYHDAELFDICLGPRREATLTFDLYPVFYPEKPRVTVRFGGIFNFDSVVAFLETVRSDLHQPDAYFARCDTLHLDSKKPSKENDVNVFLELSPYGSIRLHCQHLEETRLRQSKDSSDPGCQPHQEQ